MLREAAAEFTGVLMIVIFGTGVLCQVVLSSNAGVSATSKGVSTSTGGFITFAYLCVGLPFCQYWMGNW
jgi:glycerol uptake facilitator-like aquaporin